MLAVLHVSVMGRARRPQRMLCTGHVYKRLLHNTAQLHAAACR